MPVAGEFDHYREDIWYMMRVYVLENAHVSHIYASSWNPRARTQLRKLQQLFSILL